MVTLVKLGGSLITDKNKEKSYRHDVVQRIGRELRTVMDVRPDLRLVVGHGSGSFGHFEAKRHNTIAGVSTQEQWTGFARVAHVAAELSQYLCADLFDVGVPVFRVQPSASSIAKDGVVTSMGLDILEQVLDKGLIPVVHGDVAFDTVRGGTIISTETIFDYLVANMKVEEIVLLGEVDGVLDGEGKVIEKISPLNISIIEEFLAGSSGVDVTGGMLTKVRAMMALFSYNRFLTIRIINGNTPDLLQEILTKTTSAGTLLAAN